MARGKKRVRDEVIYGAMIIGIIVIALLIDWWSKHSAIAWTLLGILVVGFGYSLYRFPSFRGWIFKKSKSAGTKVVFTDQAPGREQIPSKLYAQVMTRANSRCQNPDCKYQGKPQVHHINQNNRDNRFFI